MLYAALWRALPGPRLVRAVLCLVLLAAVVAGCFLWLFPRVAPALPCNDNTVSGQAAGQHAAHERMGP